MLTTTLGHQAGPLSIFAAMRAESARCSAIRESRKQLRRASRAIEFGDFAYARRALCKALAAANSAKSASRSSIFRALNACQTAARNAARNNGCNHAQ